MRYKPPMRCSLTLGTRAEIQAVVFGGEALEPQRLKTWRDNHPGLPRLLNLYGTTETTVHASFREIVDGDIDSTTSPVGVPMAHLAFFVLDGVVAAGAGRCGRGAVCGRHGRGVWVLAAVRVDRVAVCGVPVRGAWVAHVSHRGSGAVGR